MIIKNEDIIMTLFDVKGSLAITCVIDFLCYYNAFEGRMAIC